MYLKNLSSHMRYVPRLDRGIQGCIRFIEGVLLSFALYLTGPRDQVTGRRRVEDMLCGVLWARLFKNHADLNLLRKTVKKEGGGS